MILGLDHASDRYHLVEPRRCLEWHLRLKDKKLTPEQRRKLLCDSLDLALNDALTRIAPGWTEDFIYVMAEEPLALANGKTTRILGLAAGAMWHVAQGKPIVWFWIEMAKWQSWCGIKQNLQTEQRKELSRAWAIDHGAPEDWEEDHYDSFCLGLYGEHLLLKEAMAC